MFDYPLGSMRRWVFDRLESFRYFRLSFCGLAFVAGHAKVGDISDFWRFMDSSLSAVCLDN